MALVLVAGLPLWAPTYLVICHRNRTRRDTRGILSFTVGIPNIGYAEVREKWQQYMRLFAVARAFRGPIFYRMRSTAYR